MFSFLGTCVQYGFYGTALATAGVGYILHKTIPSDDSFHKFRSETEPTSGSQTVDKIVINTFGGVDFQHYVIFKLALLKHSPTSKDKTIFIGLANNWIRLK